MGQFPSRVFPLSRTKSGCVDIALDASQTLPGDGNPSRKAYTLSKPPVFSCGPFDLWRLMRFSGNTVDCFRRRAGCWWFALTAAADLRPTLWGNDSRLNPETVCGSLGSATRRSGVGRREIRPSGARETRSIGRDFQVGPWAVQAVRVVADDRARHGKMKALFSCVDAAGRDVVRRSGDVATRKSAETKTTNSRDYRFPAAAPTVPGPLRQPASPR